ncbi:I66 family serine proteinase inhibitor [Streptomyces sp. NPDC058372]|uniref:I66 family serine proteinase inhibitor n=1 Tax=Streptomyces sp. NPDC058372 TaxID=3346464 RepID=UPI0036695AAC
MTPAEGTARRTFLRTGAASLAALAAGAVLTPSAHAAEDARDQPMSPLTLWLRGAPAFVRDGRLFTDLVGDQRPEQWLLSAQPQHGPDTFVIEKADRSGVGLVTPEEAGEPVAVRPLIVMPSYPPRFPQTELFRITPVDAERRAYLVTSALPDGAPRHLARARMEDFSLRPKPVFARPALGDEEPEPVEIRFA